LTEPLQNFKGREWNQAVAKLRRLKLLAEASSLEPGTLDAHPLVREYFKQQLKHERSDAWQEGNNRLYEHLERTTKEFPDTVEEMSPLYAAISHACAAGRHQEALTLHQGRIQRGNKYFSLKRLGAFGADLAALSGFFEIPWEKPVAGLTEAQKALVLSNAGGDLRALGRLQEATQLMEIGGLTIYLAQEEWQNAAILAINLSAIYLTMGALLQALSFSEQSMNFADNSGYKGWQKISRAAQADALHQAGRIAEAAAAFEEARKFQQEHEPTFSSLYSLPGFQYCDLLLDQERVQEVNENATRSLDLAERKNWLLEMALDNLSLGRACLAADDVNVTQAAGFVHRAVEGLRQAAHLEFLPRGILARAELYRITRDWGRAERDLAEVLRIATRSGMGLYLADYYLESARLQLARGKKDKARGHWTTARDMIDDMGYHRRDKEVDEIAVQLR
jgi:hypothetical protein